MECLRQLGTGLELDKMKDNTWTGSETIRKYIDLFCRGILLLYGMYFLNSRPGQEKIKYIETEYTEPGLLGCFDAVDRFNMR